MQIEKKKSIFFFICHRAKTIPIVQESNADCLDSYPLPKQKGNFLPAPWILTSLDSRVYPNTCENAGRVISQNILSTLSLVEFC